VDGRTPTRELARKAQDKWDRGTYVRNCVATAWIALETSCQEALSSNAIGYSFKANLDKALADPRTKLEQKPQLLF
jgi:hypothetical protein